MKIKTINGEYIATISVTDNDNMDYGTCPKCDTDLEKTIFRSKKHLWGRLCCPKCSWLGLQEDLEGVELDQVKSFLKHSLSNTNTQTNHK